MAEVPEYVVTGGYKRRFYLRPFTGTEVFCVIGNYSVFPIIQKTLWDRRGAGKEGFALQTRLA